MMDAWEEGEREAQGNIQSNRKFRTRKVLAAYVHSKGLKLGITSSPCPNSCQAAAISKHRRDHNGKAEHDCPAGAEQSVAHFLDIPPAFPRRRIGFERRTSRTLISSRFPRRRRFAHAAPRGRSFPREVGGNLWRTTGDNHDSWESISGFDQDPLSRCWNSQSSCRGA